MHAAHTLRLVESIPTLDRRSIRARRTLRCVPVKTSARRSRPRKASRRSPGWIKHMLLALLIAGEWLLVLADVVTRFYLLV
jgi:hypothetical protein